MKIITTKTFKKNFKQYKHNQKVLKKFKLFIDILIENKKIPKNFHLHKLKGQLNNHFEVHLFPDILIIYLKIEHNIISLENIGSHTDLF
jgi:mRNA interferase YafQ